MSTVNRIRIGFTTLSENLSQWHTNLTTSAHNLVRSQEAEEREPGNEVCPHAFSRVSCQLQVLASSFDWFPGLSVSFVIGHSESLMCDDHVLEISRLTAMQAFSFYLLRQVQG